MPELPLPIEGTVTGVTTSDEHVTIALAGEFDSASAHLVLDTGVTSMRPAVRGITLDMSLVTHVDSSTISAIVRLWKLAVFRGTALDIVVRHPVVFTVMRLAGLPEIMVVRVAD